MASGRTQDLVFTLFGDYFLHREGPVWVGTLIDLLERLGQNEGSTRTTLSRMVGRGWLESDRAGRYSFYELSQKARRLLERGESRIYHPEWDIPWDGRWFLVAYSIPEDRRRLRGRLRDRLGWLGFGSLRNGLWISPHDVEDEFAELADELHLDDEVVAFRAETAERTESAELVATCWDLPALNREYEAFIERWVPELRRCGPVLGQGKVEPEEAFILRFRLIHEYRDFPLRDPYLPRALLPSDWGGECAAYLFRHLHETLSPAADRFVDDVVSDAPSPDGAAATT